MDRDIWRPECLRCQQLQQDSSWSLSSSVWRASVAVHFREDHYTVLQFPPSGHDDDPVPGHDDPVPAPAPLPDGWLPWEPAADVRSKITQAVGAASMCWTDMTGAGVFDDARARRIVDCLVDLVNEQIQVAVAASHGEHEHTFGAPSVTEPDTRTGKPAMVHRTCTVCGQVRSLPVAEPW